jgi:uncharacterized protein YxjI
VRFVLQPSDASIFVSDEAGRDVCWVEGPTGRLGRWSVRDLAGAELASVRQHGSPFQHRFGIYASGRRVATLEEQPAGRLPRAAAALRNAVLGAPRRIRYAVDVVGGEPLRIEGDPMALEYAFLRRGREVATVSAYWLTGALTWGATVTLAGPDDTLVLLAAAATIEIAWGRLGPRSSQPAPVLSAARR